MENSVAEKLELIMAHIDAMGPDVIKFEKGQTTAGRRLRVAYTSLLELIKTQIDAMGPDVIKFEKGQTAAGRRLRVACTSLSKSFQALRRELLKPGEAESEE